MSSLRRARVLSLLATTLVSGFLVAGSASAMPAPSPERSGEQCTYSDEPVDQTQTPSRPKDLVVKQKGSSNAKVTWKSSKRMTFAPFQGVEDSYVVQYQQDGGKWFGAYDLPASSCEAGFYQMGEAHYFKFRVAGVNDEGRGPWAVTKGKFRIS